MLLHDLIRQFDPAMEVGAIPNVRVRSVQENSQLVGEGDLFVARPGTRADGAAYAADAQQRGAVAVVAPAPIPTCTLPQIIVADVASAGSVLANLVLGNPSQHLGVLGITGTNGKTTTAFLIRHIFAKTRVKCGMVGTVEVDDGQTRAEANMTTPSGPAVAQLLARMRAHGCRAVAMEVSSHALDQGRVAGVRFAGAGFTNLTGDHLDYHETMENYAAAKARLFEGLSEDAVAVVNERDEWTWRMLRDCPGRVVRFGFSPEADYRARDYRTSAQGTHFVLATPDGETEVAMPLGGQHNIENALLAIGLACETFGVSVHQVAQGLRDAQCAPGRLQAVHCGQPFAVLVDYAHTDDALRNVLRAARQLCKGKLRVLFGCGGERDRNKRPRMARAAQELADAVYITSDNPRSEDPLAIIEQICAGLTGRDSGNVYVEPDRRAAIEKIIGDAGPGDVVLLAGKGHETYQHIGSEKRHFDDAEEAARVLQSRAASF